MKLFTFAKYIYVCVRFFAGIYSCRELDDMKPEQIILYYSQILNPLQTVLPLRGLQKGISYSNRIIYVL